MIDLFEKNPCDNAMVASILLAQAGLSVMELNGCCGYCPVEIEEFRIDVKGIEIKSNGKTYFLRANLQEMKPT